MNSEDIITRDKEVNVILRVILPSSYPVTNVPTRIPQTLLLVSRAHPVQTLNKIELPVVVIVILEMILDGGEIWQVDAAQLARVFLIVVLPTTASEFGFVVAELQQLATSVSEGSDALKAKHYVQLGSNNYEVLPINGVQRTSYSCFHLLRVFFP